MKAVYITEFGRNGNIEIRDVPEPPKPLAAQILINVKAAGINRADILQKKGFYPPPSGYSPNIPGLEFAGEVVGRGENAERFSIGERVLGITAGEAQAEFLIIDERLAAKIPDAMSFIEAAAVPEVFITAHDALFTQACLQAGERLLIHAVASGVGLAALQLAKALGAGVIGTSRTPSKLRKCKPFGLDGSVVAGGKIDFAGAVMELTNGAGADVILDLVGGAYFEQNLNSIAETGRIMLVGLTAGSKAEFDLGIALSKRLTITGTVLRSRSIAEKAVAVANFERDVLPQFSNGKLRPNLDRVFELQEIAAAHEYIESNESFGKAVIRLS